MAHDSMDPLRDLPVGSAASLGGASSPASLLKELNAGIANQTSQREELLDAVRPRWLRDLERQEGQMRDAMMGPTIADLASQAGLSGTLAEYARASIAASEIEKVAREHERSLLSMHDDAMWRATQANYGASALDAGAFGMASAYEAGFSLRNAAVAAGLGPLASPQINALGAYDSVVKSAQDYFSSAARASGWKNALEATAGLNAYGMLRDYVADQFLASTFNTKTFAEKIFKLTEGFNAAQGKTAADLFGVATAVRFSNAAAGIGEQIFGRLPDFADVATVGDLRDLIDDLDIGGLRDAIRDLSAKVERTGRRDPLAWASFVVAVISLLGLFVQIAMDYAKDAEKTSLRSAPTAVAKAPLPKKQPRAQVLVVRAKRVAIRIAPSTTQTKIGEGHEGALLTILNVKAGWARVNAVDLSGEGASVTGWIPLRYTTPVAAESMHTLVCALLDASDAPDDESCVSSDPRDVH